ncbi:hypothetical protein C8R45DRAFT_929760 [Mycena sanguinolenta]|nr:hypothetical protein C8R45DRAFT_929760 [Mycena sanguinolenta]
MSRERKPIATVCVVPLPRRATDKSPLGGRSTSVSTTTPISLPKPLRSPRTFLPTKSTSSPTDGPRATRSCGATGTDSHKENGNGKYQLFIHRSVNHGAIASKISPDLQLPNLGCPSQALLPEGTPKARSAGHPTEPGAVPDTTSVRPNLVVWRRNFPARTYDPSFLRRRYALDGDASGLQKQLLLDKLLKGIDLNDDQVHA